MKRALPFVLLLVAACQKKKDEPLLTPKADEEVVTVSVTGMS